MELKLKSGFGDEDRVKLGPPKMPQVFSTERHVYVSPFNYTNVTVGNFYEYGDQGMEFAADKGFITIEEVKPIVAVTVVGSGCVQGCYNICEWWNEGESIDDMKGQLIKRQRVDNLNGTHPSIWALLLMGAGKWRQYTFDSVTQSEVKGVMDCLRKLSQGFYEGVYLGFYENTAYFRVGPPYPHKVTIRAGCKVPEAPGTSIERYPGDYAIRLIETIVTK